VDLLPLLVTGLILGSVHAFEADHMAAVSAFAIQRPRPGAALGFGVRWAAGHGGVLVLIGATVILLGVHVPADAGGWLERVVGVVLIGLGVWTVRGGRTLQAHTHDHGDGRPHTHVHSQLLGHGHRHGHAATAMGALHGLAGTAPALALMPLASLSSPGAAVLYLLLFAAGTAMAMALFALMAGWVAGRAAERSVALARGISVVTGSATVLIGFYWLLH
jgi:nickel/cobalt transporter (NicO) family protein